MSQPVYSVSYMATANDNGHCFSTLVRAEAERFRLSILHDYYHVSAIQVTK